MKIYLNQATTIGNAKAFLLHQILTAAAKQQGHEIITEATHAELAFAFNQMPNNPQLQGKKVFVVEVEQAFNAPEQVIQNALSQAIDYVDTGNSVESAVGNTEISVADTKTLLR